MDLKFFEDFVETIHKAPRFDSEGYIHYQDSNKDLVDEPEGRFTVRMSHTLASEIEKRMRYLLSELKK